MLETVSEFFNFLAEFIQLAWSIISHVFESLTVLYNLILNFISSLPGLISSLPLFLQGFATMTVCVYITFLVINRSHGGGK